MRPFEILTLALLGGLSLLACDAEVVDLQSGGAQGSGSTGSAGDPCAAVSCEAPPAPACVSASTLRSHEEKGSCAAGECSYGYVDTLCPAGCSEGACKPSFPGARLTCGGHTCAITAAGGLSCWGDNAKGQLGDGTTIERHQPTAVKGLSSSISSLAHGSWHSCAATTAGGLACWGDNFAGQLGLGSMQPSLVPKALIGASAGVVAVAGAFQTCALDAMGALTCWGSNNYGQVGDGTTTDRLAPVPVVGLSTGVVAVAASYLHTCALIEGGKVKCWGFNDSGELGNGGKKESHVPVEVADLSSVVSLAAGDDHDCALTSAGALRCWGWNDHGQLGDGTTKNRTKPVDIVGVPADLVAVAAGATHTCVLTGAGAVWCWGWNLWGQLGDGTLVESHVPIPVKGLSSGVSTLAAGGASTCAILTSGGMKCWGDNQYGQLGDGTTTNRSLPVEVSGF
jgi:alpha-tubulin suppressor-like RCC1 family protein